MTPLGIKELAAALGYSEHYVYQMHALGFPMLWRTFNGCGDRLYLSATVQDARTWIAANDFRLVNGWGMTGGFQYFLPFELQVEQWTDGRTVVKT